MANKKKRCKCCGDYGEVSEGVQTPNGFFIDYSHAIKHSIDASRKRSERLRLKALRVHEQEAKNAAKRDRERKMEVKPLSYWMKRAQNVVNRYVRVRDANLPCISCGRPPEWGGQWHASHFRSVGAASNLRFNLKNIHKSCSICNSHLSGNIMHYRPALIEKIGYSEVERLESDNSIKKYSVEYLKKIERVFKKKIALIETRRG